MIITDAGPCYLCDAETESALPSGIRVCAPCERREFPVRVRSLNDSVPVEFNINLGWSPRAG